MPTSDEEIEQTRKKSEELAAQFEALKAEALDPNKQLAPLIAAVNQEFERMGEIVETPGVKPGTGIECFVTAAEVIGDWAELEANIIVAAAGTAPRPAAASARPGMRRGMRI